MQANKELYLLNKQKILGGLDSRSKKVDFYPKEMDIEITSYCNYKCTMCPHSLTGNQLAENMPFEKLKKLESLFPYCKRIMIQGDGEPLMHPNFIEISKYIKGFGCYLCTTTNLSLLSEESAKVLANEYELVTVSCDAGNKALYESIRKNGNFERFTENLRLLMRYADSDKIVINAVVMRQNIAHLDELLHYLSNCGVKKVVFSNLLTTPYLKNEKDSVNLMGHTAIEFLKNAETVALELGIDLIINWDYNMMISEECEFPEKLLQHRTFSQSEIDSFTKEYQKLRTIDNAQILSCGKYHCNGICRNIYEKIYIDVCGNMTLCCYGKLSPIANIFDENFDEIWNGEIYQTCRQAFFSGNLPNFCIGCRYAMAADAQPMQEYPFKITDMDQQFAEDTVFWENR